MTNEEQVAEIHKTDISVPWVAIPCENDGVKWQTITRADKWQFHICSTYGPANVAEHIVKLHNESIKAKPTPPKEATAIMPTEEVRVLRAKCEYLFKLNENLAKMCAEIDVRRPIIMQMPEGAILNRPATPSEGLVEELREWVKEGAPMERRLTGFSDAIAEVAEIISRHTGGKGVGV